MEIILQPDRKWEPSSSRNSYSALFEYGTSTPEGVPAPSPGLLLHPHIKLIPFPSCFPALHKFISKLKQLDQTLMHTFNHDLSKSADATIRYKSLAREKVSLTSKYLVKMLPQLNSESVDIIIPFVLEMFDDPVTSVQAAWVLFSPIAQILGPAKSAQTFLPYLIKLFDAEESTPKHMKLYHRTFILQLIIRLGLDVFLANFSTLLVEAVAAYKDFICDDNVDQQIQNENDLFPIDINGFSTSAEVPSNENLGVVEEEDSVTENTEDESKDEDDTYEETPHVSEVDDEFVERMSLEGQEEDNKSVPVDLDDDFSDDNILSSVGTNNATGGDTSSVCSADLSEDSLGRSVGHLSVHSLSRLVEGQHDRSPSESSQDGAAESSGSRRPSGVSMEGRTEAEGDEDEDDDTALTTNIEDVPLPNMVRSETEEFKVSYGLWCAFHDEDFVMSSFIN